ncbi:hypothetical protein [Haloarcula marismortui]|uniref:Uncharacterized protein n=1 Tax=Haloarcula marismortui ATCC 33799 TaxID=662475 RepID=M0K0I6_9EURY|nr:hypothetical protein [Haloarcula californiae]EMA14932.1 hypothetical protein C435_14817 [Haloarcula californiae ATCC 33799]
MVRPNVTTESFSKNGLFPRRRLHVSDKTVDTPAKAIPASKRRGDDPELSDESTGVNEIYRTVDAQQLREERQGESDAIRSSLQRAVNKTNDGELNVVFLAFEETRALQQVEAEFIVDLLGTYSDVLVMPLQYKLARAVGTDDEAETVPYQEYRTGVNTFIDTARKLHPDAPIMGTVSPRLSWENVQDLMGVYERQDIYAYCLNMDRLKATSKRQVSVIEPMMRNIARRGIEEDVLFYGINLSAGSNDAELGMAPAADLAALGLGLDIIGECHVPPRIPAEAFDDEGEETVTFELFDETSFARREVLLADLPQELPADSSFDPEYVVKEGAQSKQKRRRLEKLVNAELMGQAATRLQSEIASGTAFQSVTSKRGVRPQTATAYQTVRDGFDDGQNQSGLNDFI